MIQSSLVLFYSAKTIGTGIHPPIVVCSFQFATPDPDSTLGNLTGKHILCLAAGGGRQSIAFALLGANVSILDLSAEQLERDRQMAHYYNLQLTLQQGDMRDLSMFAPHTFDMVYHPYSLNFVPDSDAVFQQVRGVLKVGGLYRLMCANPFALGVSSSDWNGTGYPLKLNYLQGQQIHCSDEDWVYDRKLHEAILPPVEYRQTLSKLINGLVANAFVILSLQETGAIKSSYEAAPGTWDHLSSVLPPWLNIDSTYRPDVFGMDARFPA